VNETPRARSTPRGEKRGPIPSPARPVRSPPERLARLSLPIETPRLSLRLPSRRDVTDLRRSFRDRRTARAVGARLHSLEEMRDPARMVRRTRREFREGTDLSLSVIQRNDGRCIGRVGLRGLDWNWRTAESLSYWIDPRFWNRGYATEASWFLCRAGFRQLGLRRIGSSALDSNVASLRVLKKLGFVREGRQRQSVRVAGRSMDMLMYGLLRDEQLSWGSITREAASSPGRKKRRRRR
jgi:[ribosomal protein S5]-alanine N-acetyltransferase